MVKIQKNEVILRDQDRWLHFSNPHTIFCAEKLEDVIPDLREVERLVDANEWHAAGFLSYESASAFDSVLITHASTALLNEHSSLRSAREARFPYLWFGLYPKPRYINLPKPNQPKDILNWQPTSDRRLYDTAIAKIKEYIADGKTYQVNYTLRLEAEFNASAWEFFLHLARNQNTHATYIDLGSHAICSASPELFFELDGENITCRPMKGAVTRGRTTREDQKQSNWLRDSEKNRSENVMIVDMIRNDLGRIAKTGSVQASELFCTGRYPTLWQMTSTVSAQSSVSVTDIFRALFPSASITGAPKISTMKIINQLETAPRKIYTGAIGYIFPKRKVKFNVAIRTMLIDRKMQKAEYGVGGGIVWDSNSADEYAEALLKARVLTDSQPEFSLLETMLWTPEGGFFLREKHIDRLLDSANYFDFSISRDTVEKHLNQIASHFASAQRVRLLLDKTGKIKIESSIFQRRENIVRARLAQEPVNSKNIFLFHKTTQRDAYENARSHFPDCDDILFYNEHGELTEFTIGNLVVMLDGQFVTPPIECGVLSGTFRAHLAETGQVVERVIRSEQLKDCTQIFRVNSVRRWEKVRLGI